MQVLRLLAPRQRAASTVAAASPPPPPSLYDSDEEDDGPFFDLDFSSSSAAAYLRASSGSASSASDDSDDAACTDLDFIISLYRSRSASPRSYHALNRSAPAPPLSLKLCASDRTAAKKRYGGGGIGLRTLSFGAKRAAFYGGRPSSARSSSSARSLRLFMESPADEEEEEEEEGEEQPRRPASGDVFRRYLTKISRRLRSVRPRDATGLRRLRKSRSASAAVVSLPPASSSSRRDDSLIEKQDGIASAIAHCKESFHRASSVSDAFDFDSPLLRSRSDPGQCEAAKLHRADMPPPSRLVHKLVEHGGEDAKVSC